jgi:hypothetical protein
MENSLIFLVISTIFGGYCRYLSIFKGIKNIGYFVEIVITILFTTGYDFHIILVSLGELCVVGEVDYLFVSVLVFSNFDKSFYCYCFWFVF